MSTQREWFKPASLRSLVLPTLAITLGMQVLRVFIPGLAWYMKDTVGVGSITLAGYAFGAFLPAFLAAVLRRLAGPRISLWISAGGLAVLRLVEQLLFLPEFDIWISMAGTVMFLLFLPIFVGHVRAKGGDFAAPRLGFGILLGLTFDTAIHGAASTLDLSWIPGILPLLAVFITVGLVFWALVDESFPDDSASSEAGWGAALSLFAIGPFLVFQAVVLQNQGWLTQVGRLGPSAAFAVVMIGNVVAIGGMAWAFARPHTFHPLLGFAAAFYLGWAGLSADTVDLGYIITAVISQLLFGWGLAALMTKTVVAKKRGLWRTTLGMGLGMIVFLLLAFVYYVSLDIALPIPRAAILPASTILFGLIILLISLRLRNLKPPVREDWTSLVIALVLLLVPLLHWLLLGATPEAEEPPGLPITVMTYNVHSAFDVGGLQDPEAIANVIEESGAKIIALQEVSRGWLIDGSTDLATWLSRRLGMQVLFEGTTGPMWGNAILTAYPILDHGSGAVPDVGMLMARGYLWADIDIGEDDPLLVIATHLHHEEEDNYVRLEQVPVLIDFWDGAPFTLILGDLNARPEFPEIDLFRDAGLIDSWEEAGEGEGLTFASNNPYQRIDWIWHTDDLRATQAEIIMTTASDHIPVLVTIDAAP
jgi:endonuclease/exonuclease/phosphatase family metal-dependent hydrolase